MMKKLMIAIALSLSFLFSSATKAELEWEHIEFIWEWTKEELKYEGDEPICSITIVPRSTIIKVWMSRTCKYLADYIDEYGIEKGTEQFVNHATVVRAFFDKKEPEIYLTDFNDDCIEASLLAHEFTHYIQYLKGTLGDDPHTHSNNELEAEAIEGTYYNIFCSGDEDLLSSMEVFRYKDSGIWKDTMP
jgi:hypothetical protein